MSSIYGFDNVDDIFNENIQQNDALPFDFDEDHNAADGNNAGGDDALPFDFDEDHNAADGDNAGGDDADDAGGGGDGVAINVEPKKRTIRHPRIRLSLETLSGHRGIQTIEDYFKDIKFRGKGREKEDLDEVLRRLQHWGHRMYPSYKFDDVLNKIEALSKKKALHVHMSRYRLGMLEDLRKQQEDALARENEEGAAMDADGVPEPFDEFDALLDEQIAMSRIAAPSYSNTPFHQKRRDDMNSSYASSALATPSFAKHNAVMSTPYATHMRDINDSDLALPLPPSQPENEEQLAPAVEEPRPKLTAEQMARIAENRRIAQERLRAKREQMMQQKLQEQAAQVDTQVERE